MIKTIFEEREDIGRAEGKVEGKVEAGRNMVLTILRARFKKVPKEVARIVFAMNDPTALESWAAHAATCKTMDEFADALK